MSEASNAVVEKIAKPRPHVAPTVISSARRPSPSTDRSGTSSPPTPGRSLTSPSGPPGSARRRDSSSSITAASAAAPGASRCGAPLPSLTSRVLHGDRVPPTGDAKRSDGGSSTLGGASGRDDPCQVRTAAPNAPRYERLDASFWRGARGGAASASRAIGCAFTRRMRVVRRGLNWCRSLVLRDAFCASPNGTSVAVPTAL